MGIRSSVASAVRSLADKIGKPSFAGTPFPDGGVEKREQLVQELGGTGTFNFGGFIRGEDFNPQMDAQTAITNLDEMRRSDSQVHAALEVVKQPIRTADYELDPSDPDDPVSNEIAEFVRWNLFEGMVTTWDDVIRQALLMLDFGFMLFEKVWTVAEDGPYKGHIVLHKMAARPPKTIWQWFTDEDGSLVSIKQLAVKAGTYQFLDVPSSKLVRFTFQQEGDNFTGISMLRSAYPHWLIKKQLYLIDAIRATRFGVGIPRAKLKAGYKPTEEDRSAIALMLQGLSSHQHAYLIEPEQMEVDILMPQGVQGGAQLLPSINHQNEQITRNILAQFLDMGGKSSGGSRALGASAMDFFLNAIESIADQICDVLNKQLIKDLVDMNFDVAKYPTLRPVGIQETDVKSLAAAYAALATAGLMTADRKTENTFRNLMNLPEVAEDGTPEAGDLSAATGQQPAPQQPGDEAPPKPGQPPAAPAATGPHHPAPPAPPGAHPAATTATKPAPAKTSALGPAKAATTATQVQPAKSAATKTVPAKKAPNPQRGEQMDDDAPPEAGGQPLPAAAHTARPAAKTEQPATTNVTNVVQAVRAPEASRDVARQPGYTKPAEGVAARPREVPKAGTPPVSHDPRGMTTPATSGYDSPATAITSVTDPTEARTTATGTLPANTTVSTSQPAVPNDVRAPQAAVSQVSNVIPATAHMARSTTTASSGAADEEGHTSSGRTATAAAHPRRVAASETTPPLTSAGTGRLAPDRTAAPGTTGTRTPETAPRTPPTVALATRRKTPTPTSGTLWRDPTPLESRVLELREIPRRLDTARTALLATLRSVREEQISRIASAVAHGKADSPVKPPLVGKMAAEIGKVMEGVFEYGHEQVVAELRKQGLRTAAAVFADNWEGMSEAQHARALAAPKARKQALPHLQASAQLSAQSASDRLVGTARAEALRLQRAGWDEDEIEDALLVHMGELTDGDIMRIAGQKINESFSMGRVAAGEEFKDSIEMAVYSAILDVSVCDTCEALDGEEYDVDSDEYEENMPPNQNCDGGDSCRCSYIYVLKEPGSDVEAREFALAASDWEEEKHPRGPGGKFGAGSGGEKKKATVDQVKLAHEMATGGHQASKIQAATGLPVLACAED